MNFSVLRFDSPVLLDRIRGYSFGNQRQGWRYPELVYNEVNSPSALCQCESGLGFCRSFADERRLMMDDSPC
jgi:hypothetical protein